MASENDNPTDMGLCEMTGQTLPKQLLVHFRGRWVGPDGKRILLEQLKSGETEVPAETDRIAGALRRILCILLDIVLLNVGCTLLLFCAGFLIGLVLVAKHENPTEISSAMNALRPLLQLTSYTGSMVVFLGYYFLCYWRGGRTVGKMVGSLRVVSMSGGPLTARQAFVRSFVFTFGMLIPLAVQIIIYFSHGGARSTAPTQAAALSDRHLMWGATAGNLLWLLIDYSFFQFSSSRRALHDLAAGTRVVRTFRQHRL